MKWLYAAISKLVEGEVRLLFCDLNFHLTVFIVRDVGPNQAPFLVDIYFGRCGFVRSELLEFAEAV